MDNVPLEDYQATAELVALLRVADGLDFGYASGSPDKIERVEMARVSGGIECRITPQPGKGQVTDLLKKAREKSEVFEACFGKLTFWLPGAARATSWVLWDDNK